MPEIIEVDVHPPSNQLGQTHYVFEHGVINNDAVEYFANAWCAHLASAFHDRFGWGLVATFRTDLPGLLKVNQFRHLAAQLPDGRVVDVFGVRDVERLGAPYVRRATRMEFWDDLEPWFAMRAEAGVVQPVRDARWWRSQVPLRNGSYADLVFSFVDALLVEAGIEVAV